MKFLGIELNNGVHVFIYVLQEKQSTYILLFLANVNRTSAQEFVDERVFIYLDKLLVKNFKCADYFFSCFFTTFRFMF